METAPSSAETADSAVEPAGRVAPGVWALVTGLFFLSGSAGLVYQVLWMRSLGLFLGSDMYGVAIILSTFMGGLALGSLFGGRLAEYSTRPLMWYGMFEVGIGLFALVFGGLVQSLDPILRGMYSETAAPGWSYQTVRVLLASSSLLIPTTFMGATLPLILRHFVRSRSSLGAFGAWFYAVNTLGALAGTLAAGFALLPRLGMTRATLCAAAVNLTIGIICTALGLTARLPDQLRAGAEKDREVVDPIPLADAALRSRMARAAVLAFAVSGFASFALEVVWTRILLISVSATVYSFASMLACFLFGIFLGSAVISQRVDSHPSPIRLFANLELGVGLSVGVLCLAINAIPGFFSGLLGGVSAILSDDLGSVLVVATLAASFILLVIPTTLLGATFPVALRAYTTSVNRIGSRSGNLYFANTLGAILGSLCGGLVLIPTFGTKASLALVALIFTANGIYLDRAAARGRPSARVVALAVAALVVSTAGLAMPYRVTLNFNQRAGAERELLYHAEGIQNTIDVVRSHNGVTSLVIGGNIEADDGPTQRAHFVLKGHLPLLFLEEPREVLVVGLGMGITLQSSLRHPGVERVDVIELSPEILEAQSLLREINGAVVEDPRVHVRIDDGRSFMKMSQRQFDMVTADPIHPKVSRVGYLYTREYYQSVRDRLRDGGVVCQWMPIYQMSPLRLRSAMKTFAEVFPEATFWYVKNHGLFVAQVGESTLDYGRIVRRYQDPQVHEDLASVGLETPEKLLSLLLMGPDEIRAYVDSVPDVPLNTDDHPYLEYYVPRDLYYQPIDNVREIVPHLADPTRFVKNLPPDVAARIRELSADRATRLVAELER